MLTDANKKELGKAPLFICLAGKSWESSGSLNTVVTLFSPISMITMSKVKRSSPA